MDSGSSMDSVQQRTIPVILWRSRQSQKSEDRTATLSETLVGRTFRRTLRKESQQVAPARKEEKQTPRETT